MLVLFALLLTATSFGFVFPLSTFVGSYFLDILDSIKFVFVFLALLLSLLLLFTKKSKTVLLHLFFANVVLVVVHVQSLGLVSKNSEIPINTQRISVAQINLNYHNQTIASSLKKIGADKLDLVVLMEFSDKNRSLFLDLKQSRYSFGDQPIEGFPTGIGVLSNYPIIYKTVHLLGRGKSSIVELKVLVNNAILNLFITHPPSPRSKEKWELRNETLDKLSKLVQQEQNKGGQILIVGDFNTVPWSSHFATLNTMSSCFKSAGAYISWSPIQTLDWIGLPIDHCFVSDHWLIEDLKTLPFEGSDHRALVYDLVLKSSFN